MTDVLRRPWWRSTRRRGPADAPTAERSRPPVARAARTAPAEPTGPRPPSVEELAAESSHAQQRELLYQRRVLLGRGELPRLAELQRISAGAAARLRRARDAERSAP